MGNTRSAFKNMDLNLNNENLPPALRMKKYRQAGYGFLALNVIYVIAALVFMPPFDLMTAAMWCALFLALMTLFTVYILKGNRRLVQVLTVIYGARSVFSTYSLLSGETFAAVPYLLPCLVLIFYLLGRAGWNWP